MSMSIASSKTLSALSLCNFTLISVFASETSTFVFPLPTGWSGGAMVLRKLPVPGRPTNLDYSRARAYCPCSRCGWGLFGHFYSHLSFSPLSPSLWETARYRLKYCLKGPLNPKKPTIQPFTNNVTRFRG